MAILFFLWITLKYYLFCTQKYKFVVIKQSKVMMDWNYPVNFCKFTKSSLFLTMEVSLDGEKIINGSSFYNFKIDWRPHSPVFQRPLASLVLIGICGKFFQTLKPNFSSLVAIPMNIYHTYMPLLCCLKFPVSPVEFKKCPCPICILLGRV